MERLLRSFKGKEREAPQAPKARTPALPPGAQLVKRKDPGALTRVHLVADGGADGNYSFHLQPEWPRLYHLEVNDCDADSRAMTLHRGLGEDASIIGRSEYVKSDTEIKRNAHIELYGTWELVMVVDVGYRAQFSMEKSALENNSNKLAWEIKSTRSLPMGIIPNYSSKAAEAKAEEARASSAAASTEEEDEPPPPYTETDIQLPASLPKGTPLLRLLPSYSSPLSSSSAEKYPPGSSSMSSRSNPSISRPPPPFYSSPSLAGPSFSKSTSSQSATFTWAQNRPNSKTFTPSRIDLITRYEDPSPVADIHASFYYETSPKKLWDGIRGQLIFYKTYGHQWEMLVLLTLGTVIDLEPDWVRKHETKVAKGIQGH